MRALKSVISLVALVLIGLVGAACAPPGSVGTKPVSFTSAGMGVTLPVYEGVSQSVVDRGGVAWDDLSASLGQPGTTLLFGHRASHGSPFRHLDSLRPGSTLTVGGSDGRTYVYTVVGTRIVRPTWADILAFHPASGRGLSLISCHPVGSTAQRIVVDAELSGVR